MTDANENVTDGGPAFPMKVSMPYKKGHREKNLPGMTLRDYIAAAVISGDMVSSGGFNTDSQSTWQQKMASRAYSVADAMMKARAK